MPNEFDVEEINGLEKPKKIKKKNKKIEGINWERIIKDCMSKDDTALAIAEGLRAHNILTIEDALLPENQNGIQNAIMSAYRLDIFSFLQSLRKGAGG